MQVPGLNAYGRYVQRTGYAALDPHVLKRAMPVWFSFNTAYDSQDQNQPHRVQFGNAGIHAIGAIGRDGEWTYHVQQWIVQNNQAGGLDTLWISYNKLFRSNGHLFLGKIESPAPSPFSQWFDLAAFSTPEITVGEHPYQLDANRWGARLAYVHGKIDAEAGWLGSGSDLNGATDYANDTDKTFQWKFAMANPMRPIEYGVFGSRGSYPLLEGGTDLYDSMTGYIERDPLRGMPGFLVMYQAAHDANPGNGSPSAASTAATLELYRPVFRDGILGVRKEWQNDGLGDRAQIGNVDFAYHVARFWHFFGEAGVGQGRKPSWRYVLWWTSPVSHVR